MAGTAASEPRILRQAVPPNLANDPEQGAESIGGRNSTEPMTAAAVSCGQRHLNHRSQLRVRRDQPLIDWNSIRQAAITIPHQLLGCDGEVCSPPFSGPAEADDRSLL